MKYMLRKIVHGYRPCVVGHIPFDKHSFAVSCSLCGFLIPNSSLSIYNSFFCSIMFITSANRLELGSFRKLEKQP
jgi:hypothetical protein